jgi:hypothetical protein
MRVAVCGWGAVRGEVHESADRRGAQERERSASARRAARRGQRRGERAHEGGGGAGVMMRSLHRGSVPLSALGTEVLQSADRGRTSSGARLESAERQRRTSAPHQSAVRRATPSSSRNDSGQKSHDSCCVIRTVHFQSLSDSTPSQNLTEEFSKPHAGGLTTYRAVQRNARKLCTAALYQTLPNHASSRAPPSGLFPSLPPCVFPFVRCCP